ncbi:TlpA family protein disulfide reductase [Sphingobacterium bovistauri]|uniref:TlpA family protein disulfide reductase n=1 Tax=Sphingobacterium bovistauri TaxID=2781959 RepID=A0ABS7Z324_9SPHI|nr:TlpA disulfide reductase family protein [Sphingobacterium bovistauri]MCA5004590.1 TlpA family protein disulfide reductase [Sphingobacterium bovistauri]
MYDYTVKINNSSGMSNIEKTYYATLQYIKSLPNKSRLMELKVVGLDLVDTNRPNREFSTLAPNKSKNFLNSSAVISELYFLKAPIRFTLNKGIVNIDTLKLRSEIQEQLRDWDIQENLLNNAVATSFNEITNLIHALYFSDLASLDAKELKKDKIIKNGITYHILKRVKSDINVHYEKLDSLSSLEGNALFDTKNLIVKVGDAKSKSFFMNNGEKMTSENHIAVYRGEKYLGEPISSDYYDMLAKISYWSSAIVVAKKVDSVKFSQFVAMYEPKYAKDRFYITAKLTYLQRLNKYDEYYKILRTVSPILLANSHHLSNKFNEGNLPADQFREAIPLLDDRQLYEYLQHSLSQHISTNNSDAMQKLEQITFHFSEREKISAYPMFIWARALQTDNVDSLKFRLADILHLDKAYYDQGNAGRYVLLVQQLLFKKGISNLPLLHQAIDSILPLYEDETNERRFVQKAHLAYAYYLAHQFASDQEEKSRSYLEKAAYYSPKSAAEKAHGSFYDRVLLKSKENYSEDYFNELNKRGKKDVALQNYVQEFLNNPGTAFQALATFYRDNYDATNFSVFLKNEVFPQLQDAPVFLLKDLQDREYSSEKFKGKWTVVDFWGTWCKSCVQEMPELNKFYIGLKNDEKSKIDFMTIACHDTKDNVQHFLTENNYEIPVLMSDNVVEKAYKVRGYPSKYIVTPEGKLIPIEFGFDWKSFVTQLANL